MKRGCGECNPSEGSYRLLYFVSIEITLKLIKNLWAFCVFMSIHLLLCIPWRKGATAPSPSPKSATGNPVEVYRMSALVIRAVCILMNGLTIEYFYVYRLIIGNYHLIIRMYIYGV